IKQVKFARNQFHQLVTNLLKNGAWLRGSNHGNPLRTLRNSTQYFILTFQLLTARYRMLLEPKVKCNKRSASSAWPISQGAAREGNRNMWL
uniref:Uncharacterized protein n=1 Tax=Aquila chrysaetos chrysaetos TaxID=223781 RepID=A0A663EYY7_AQUCH